MKRCFILLSAVCLTAVASALNVTWLNQTATPGSATVFGEGAAKGDFSIAVKLTLNDSFASGSFSNTPIATFVNSALYDGVKQGVVAFTGANGVGIHTGTTGGGNNNYAWSGDNAIGNSGTVLLVLTGDWDAANNRWATSVSANGTAVTLTAGNSSNPALTGLANGALTMEFATNDAWTFNGVAVYDEVLTQEQITELGSGVDAGLVVEGATILPEPTALALLALGVAGVALRRRAA